MTLHLVRHGRTAHPVNGLWVSARGYRAWRDAQNAAGILPRDEAPEPLLRLASRADAVVASDLRRAVESAQRLAPERTVLTSPLLREAPLPLPRWLPVPLPIVAWEAIAHAQWSFRIFRGRDSSPADLHRADQAVAWLCSLGVGSVVVVTHGVFRRVLAMRLASTGWRKPPGPRRYTCWSVWSYTERT